MITRIEIDGFKTFQEFSVDLAPFQVIIGPNGCGKSNLFDALQLLSILADRNLNTAFQSVRGGPFGLFTMLPDGSYVDRMRFAVEMRVDSVVEDEWGGSRELAFPELRYELEIARKTSENGLDRLQVAYECLRNFEEESSYIVTVPGGAEPFFGFTLEFQDGDLLKSLPHNSKQNHNPSSTTLSRLDTVETPHALAARQEMRKWRFVHLQPEEIKKSNSTLDDPVMMPSGGNTARVLAQMLQEDDCLIGDVSRDVLNLVPSFSRVEVKHDAVQQRFELFAKMRDGRRVPASLLSDGTLRLLALATLRNDPQHRGLLCLEEPENGVHPGVLERLVPMLRDMATDFSDSEPDERPLRQVLIATHSPQLVSHLNIEKGELLFADTPTLIIPGETSRLVTRIYPVLPDAEEVTPEIGYGLTRALEYMNNPDISTTRDELRKAILR